VSLVEHAGCTETLQGFGHLPKRMMFIFGLLLTQN